MTISFDVTPEEFIGLITNIGKSIGSLQLGLLQTTLDKVLTLEQQMKINVDALIAAVNQETTVDNSILKLLDQIIANNADLAQQLKAALEAGDPVAAAAVQKALDDSVATMTQNAQNIMAAVTNNTPPQPPAGS